jgi:Protein of unknown function (DUF2478)
MNIRMIETLGIRTAPPICQIAVLQGAPSATIQAVLDDFAVRAARQGHKVAGVIELPAGAQRGRVVRELSTGTMTSISQNLGHGSTACNLDSSKLIEVCAAVERSIAAGADVVVLNKFGKLEADRGGLSDAFRAAIAAELPVLTAVAPAMTASWCLFAGSLAQFIPADAGAVDAWWASVRSGMPLPACD